MSFRVEPPEWDALEEVLGDGSVPEPALARFTASCIDRLGAQAENAVSELIAVHRTGDVGARLTEAAAGMAPAAAALAVSAAARPEPPGYPWYEQRAGWMLAALELARQREDLLRALR